MSEYLEQWSKADNFLNTVLKTIASIPFYIRSVARLIKKHVNGTIDDCHLTQIHDEAGKVDKKEVPLSPIRSSMYAT